jgi:HAD superfamily PSPase-like hydrolase
MPRKFKLAAFDLDGTLTEGDPSWVMIHKKFGTLNVGEEGERLYSQGLITYRDFILRDISAWPKPLRKEELIDALRNYRLRNDAYNVIKFFREKGMKIAILTAALDLMADEIANKVGADYVFSNSLGFDSRGFFNGKVEARVEPLKKHLLLEDITGKIGIRKDEVIAVGDSNYDLSFLKAAGLGFLIGNSKLAADNGIIPVRELSEIVDYVSKLNKGFR